MLPYGNSSIHAYCSGIIGVGNSKTDWHRYRVTQRPRKNHSHAVAFTGAHFQPLRNSSRIESGATAHTNGITPRRQSELYCFPCFDNTAKNSVPVSVYDLYAKELITGVPDLAAYTQVCILFQISCHYANLSGLECIQFIYAHATICPKQVARHSTHRPAVGTRCMKL